MFRVLLTSISLLLVATASTAATINLIENGEFNDPLSTGWSVTNFGLSGGTNSTGISLFNTTGSGAVSGAAEFQVGGTASYLTFGNDQGIELSQEISLSDQSDVTFSLDIAVTATSLNYRAGNFQLVLNGVVLDEVDFGLLLANSTERSALLATVINLDSGLHNVGVRITRADALFSDSTPHQYVDNFSAIVPVSPVPLPAGGLLLLSGLASVVAIRRRKKAVA